MKTTDGSDAAQRGRSPLSDDQLERLLEDFFRLEMPAALRGGPSIEGSVFRAPQSVAVVATAGGLPQRSAAAGRWGIGAAAVALLLSAALLRSGPEGERRGSVALPSAARDGAAAPAAVAEGGTPGYDVLENVEPFEPRRIETDNGPVEQRSARRVTKVSVIDPETGERLEVELPELTIEIIPIKD